jgi:polar amino acid transport system substrate-binding protein
LQTNEVDLVISTMTINCERWEQVAFSTEYYSAGQRVLALSGSGVTGIDDLGDRKVCAAAGTTSIRNIADASSGPIPVAVADWTDCLVLLQQGQVDAISTDDTILAGLVDQDPYAQVVGPAFSSEPDGIGLPPDSPELTRLVTAVLAQITTDGTWQRLYDEWLSETLGSAAPPTSPTYRP